MKHKKTKKSKYVFWLRAAAVFCICTLAGCVFTACGSGGQEYSVTVSGQAEGPGTVSFLGYDINVYKDQAHNPCGDCEDQPVHIYQGADAEEILQAMADAAEREEGAWKVSGITKDTISFICSDPGKLSDHLNEELYAPPGVTLSDSSGNICKGSEADVSDGEYMITNLSGDKILIPEKTDRIAAVYGPSYESLYVLGQQDKVVVCADVQQETFPWAKVIFKEMNDTPCLENVHSSVNVETVMTYDPDIVFSFPRPNELKALRSAGVAAIPGEVTRKLTDVPKELMVYARAVGDDAPEYSRKYKEYFDEKYDMVTSRTSVLKSSERPEVYYAGIDLLTTYGGESDIPDLIEAAGGTAVTKELKAGNHTQVTFEQLASWDPDFIFLDHGGMNEGKTLEELQKEIYEEDRYQCISAVRNREIHLSPTGVFYWDMGLQKILLLMNVAKTIHPELFGDLDMIQEIREFYQKFYRYELSEDQAEEILLREEP